MVLLIPGLLLVIVHTGESSCQISPLLDNRFSLSFRFGTDQNLVKIESYRNGSKHEDVISCFRKNGNMTCMPTDLLMSITDSELTISVPRLKAYENIYLCHTLPSNSLDFCNSTFEDLHLSSSRPAFDENNGKHDDDIETESETTGHIVAIICSVITVVLIVILSLILLAYRKRWICKSQRSTSDSDNVDNEQRVALNNSENIDLENGLRQEQGTAPENETSGLGSS